MQKVVMGLSGGMDSATLLGILLEQGAEVHCCSFYYGSKHNKYEQEAAKKIVRYYQLHDKPVHLYLFDLTDVFVPFTSNLLLSGGDIPEGHYNDESMKLTVVPGRNMIFTSIMAGLAESIGATEVALGVHAGDHHIYPDCRPEFIKALDLAVYLSSDRKVEITTPLLYFNKATIVTIGQFNLKILVPFDMTRTCYKDQEFACGKCGSCRERLEAFQISQVLDPITYENEDKTNLE